MLRYPRLWESDNAGAAVLLILDLQAGRQLRSDDRALGRNPHTRQLLPDISNNVGSVKSFLSALLRSLLRVVFLVLL